MCTTAALYRSQFADSALTAAVNLLAIEPLGHGATGLPAGTSSEHFTYWDTAAAALQVMDALGVDKAFALGTSQGGWMVARMALLAPERIRGLLLLGTSMDYESAESREKGAWDPKTLLVPFYDKWCSKVATPEFVVDDVWCGMVGSLGFGSGGTPEVVQFWTETLKQVYRGDEGRKKLKGALACLLDRDGLLRRVRDITCPVYWLQVSITVVDAVVGRLLMPVSREPKTRRTARSCRRSRSSCSLARPRPR
jgi:microsomal epoxide hydrolase